MKEYPILFSGPMVRAILDGRKTMTRRVCKYQPEKVRHISDLNNIKGGPDLWDFGDKIDSSPYGQHGDRLWVRETWQVSCPETKYGGCSPIFQYKADYPEDGAHWRSPIHMTRLASRLTLEITTVRVERVQDISEGDVKAEGIKVPLGIPAPFELRWMKFKELWDSLNAKRGYGWGANPWVWVISFRRVKS